MEQNWSYSPLFVPNLSTRLSAFPETLPQSYPQVLLTLSSYQFRLTMPPFAAPAIRGRYASMSAVGDNNDLVASFAVGGEE